jgi:hypothetical protein
MRIPPKLLVSPLTMSAPTNFRMPQGRPDFGNWFMRNWNIRASDSSDASAEGSPVTTQAAAPLNVFGEKLEGCENEGDLCIYTSESPRLCIRTGKFTMRLGCKSIWKTDWKPFGPTIGRDGKVKYMKSKKTGVDAKPAAGDTTQCDAVPAEVLDSQYSKEQFDASYAATDYKADTEETDGVINLEIGKGEKVEKKSERADRFQRSIDFICQTCALYANSESARNTVQSKCQAIGWVGPEQVPSDTLYSHPEASPSIMSFPALVLVGIFAGSGVTFTLFNNRRCTAQTVKMSIF